MRTRTVSALLACCTAVTGCQVLTPATSTCAHVDGFLDGPHVADEETARAIANAMIARNGQLEPPAEFRLYVEDDGDHWVAFQGPPEFLVPTSDPDVFITPYGGGGLAMNIAKCDGAISNVHWQR